MLNLGVVLVLMLMGAAILFGEEGVVAAVGVVLLIAFAKIPSMRGASHHSAFMATARLIVTRF